VAVPAGGGVLKGQLDLTGLPPGNYAIVAALTLAGNTVERSAGFTMAPLDATLEKDLVRRETAKATDEGFFEAMSAEELETARAPLALIAESGELSKWSKDLSLRAKRRFMTQFWRRRDPTPETPVNETRVLFYEAVAYADRTFGGSGLEDRPGTSLREERLA
jgi:GWxTD domain-containing protein